MLSLLKLACPLLKGACLTAGLITSFGPQNMELMRLGLLKQQVFVMATIFILCDIVLVIVGAGGLGSVFADKLQFVIIANYTSAGILYYLGYKNFRNLNVIVPIPFKQSVQAVVMNKHLIYRGLILSFLNPLVVLETVVLVGGTSAQYPLQLRLFFITGSMLVSIMWFYGFSYFISRLAVTLLKPLAQRLVNVCAGMVLIVMATCQIFEVFW